MNEANFAPTWDETVYINKDLFASSHHVWTVIIS